MFEAERAAGRRLPGIGHRWHTEDLRAERTARGRGRARAGSGTWRRSGRSPPGSASTSAVRCREHRRRAGRRAHALRLDPEYGDFLFAIARSFGLAAHIVEERARERPMRLIDPTAAFYDGVPVPEAHPGDGSMKVRLISPFDDAEQIWIGLDEPGQAAEGLPVRVARDGLRGVHGRDHDLRAG